MVNLNAIAQSVWTAATRTQATGTPPAPPTRNERLAAAIWTNSTRTLTTSASTLSGTGTAAVPTGSGQITFPFTVSGAGTASAPTGTGAGLQYTSPPGTATLSGSGTAPVPLGSGSGLAFPVTLSGSGTGPVPTGLGTLLGPLLVVLTWDGDHDGLARSALTAHPGRLPRKTPTRNTI